MSRSARLPGSIIAAAIIMFIYGALLLLCVGCNGIALGIKPPDQMGLEAELDKNAPGHTVVQVVNVGFNFLFALGFIGAGIASHLPA